MWFQTNRLLANPIHAGRAVLTTGSRTIFLCIFFIAPFFCFFVSFFANPNAVHVIVIVALACPLRIILAIDSRRGRRSRRRCGCGGCGTRSSRRRSGRGFTWGSYWGNTWTFTGLGGGKALVERIGVFATFSIVDCVFLKIGNNVSSNGR